MVGPFNSKPLSQYGSIETTWSWKYVRPPYWRFEKRRTDELTTVCRYNTNQIRANVAYDTFLGTCPSCSQDFEVMFWLCDYGVVYPLSDNGYPPKPAATPNINGVDWNLVVGHNGAMKVYTFVTRYHDITSFNGDLMNFYRYLQSSFGLSNSLYLQKVQAGTEVFTGSNAVLTTSGYTITVT